MEPFERYEALCGAVIEDSKRYYEQRRRLLDMARGVAAAIHTYLGMPDGATKIVELEADRRAKGEPKVIGTDIDLLSGDDDLSYFGVSLHFERGASTYFGSITILIGIDRSETEFVVKHLTPYRLAEFSMESLGTFLAGIYAAVLENYANPRNGKRSRIGFINE